MKDYDIAFHKWLNREDENSISRFKRCTGYLSDVEKDLVYASMQIAFTAGYVYGSGLLGGGENDQTAQH